MKEKAPNPGSEEAKALGCMCPVMDNNHGKFPPFDFDGEAAWYMVEGCPVHFGGDE